VEQVARPAVSTGDESLIILESLLCMLREKNVLSRADIEELCHRMSERAAGTKGGPLDCCSETAKAASADMQRITQYIGQRYGGKHLRGGAPVLFG
jgi:hypothetical protein